MSLNKEIQEASHKIEFTQKHSVDVNAETELDAYRFIKRTRINTFNFTINDKELVGQCESCEKLIFDDEKFHSDDDGCDTCDDCAQEAMKDGSEK